MLYAYPGEADKPSMYKVVTEGVVYGDLNRFAVYLESTLVNPVCNAATY